MIGIIADRGDYPVAREFFELFKTPWEFYRPDGHYDVLLCNGTAEVPEHAVRLVLVYDGHRRAANGQGWVFEHEGIRIPIYSARASSEHLRTIVQERFGPRPVVRLAYNLFDEIRTLLTEGQPSTNAGIPSLDLHIRVLRKLIVNHGIPVFEIPPIPAGYRFIACLTHDVDHALLRRHKWDRTMWGFLYRATAGSIVRAVRGRLTLRGVLRNWLVALKLPLVHLGLARDEWCESFGRYLELEKGVPSTFFVVPYKNQPGRTRNGRVRQWRATKYGARDIRREITELESAGCEIGLHGIDAWLDSASGRAELEEIRRVADRNEIGVRMHWLFFDAQTPARLEEAGAAYDSTVGYNGTVGYRAGTTQVYKPLTAKRLLELPLHIMDTALFYPSHLDLAPKHAMMLIDKILDHAAEAGGCVTLNWHDRSIAPERLWGGFYAEILEELRKRGAWLATAGETVAWFRKRRSAAFETCRHSREVRVKDAEDSTPNLPGLRLWVHNGSALHLKGR